jgi:hypothetical protein
MKDMPQAMIDAGFNLINQYGFAGTGLRTNSKISRRKYIIENPFVRMI